MGESEYTSPSFADYFIPEFIKRMRESEECRDKPSPRQAIRMYRMMLPIFMKKGYLTLEDLVEIAVVTSKPDNQDLAKRIAGDIIWSLDELHRPLPTTQTTEDILRSLIRSKNKGSFIHLVSQNPEESVEAALDLYSETGDESGLDLIEVLLREPAPGVGPGEDKLMRAYLKSMRTDIRKESRRLWKDILKKRLIRLGWEYEHIGKNVTSYNLRPYEPGEDTELIDEEKSLESILIDQGKTVEEIAHRDFLMRKREKRPKTIVYVLDVSNTMYLESLGGEALNSIQYSVLCLIPLLYAFRRERYGLTLFESNTHVIKDLYMLKDEDELIEDLLFLATSTCTEAQRRFGGEVGEWGGTVPGASIRWMRDQLNSIRDRSEKMCFIFSDFQIEETDKSAKQKSAENYDILRRMNSEGMRVFACASPLSYDSRFESYTEAPLEKLKEAECEIFSTKDAREFLESVKEAVEKPLR